MTSVRRSKTFISTAIAVLMTIQFFCAASGRAQEPMTEESQSNPIQEAIAHTSVGTVNVEIPQELLEIIINGAPRVSTPHNQGNKPRKATSGKMQGYRIQVFADGRNPSTLGARARARGNAIVARFPKYRGQVYTFSTTPNWYTRIGNFRTAAEANAALAELKRAFPAFASEMRTVQCTVIVRNDNSNKK